MWYNTVLLLKPSSWWPRSMHLPECQSGCPTSRSHQQVEQTNPVANTLNEFEHILFLRQHLNHSKLDSHGFEGLLQSSITLASLGRDVSNQQVDLLEIRLRQPRHDSEALKCRCSVEKPKNASFSSVSAACHVCQTLLRRPGQPLKWSSHSLFSCYSIFVYYIQCSRAFCQFLFMSYQQHRGINLKKILIKRTGRYTIHNCNCKLLSEVHLPTGICASSKELFF